MYRLREDLRTTFFCVKQGLRWSVEHAVDDVRTTYRHWLLRTATQLQRHIRTQLREAGAAEYRRMRARQGLGPIEIKVDPTYSQNLSAR